MILSILFLTGLAVGFVSSFIGIGGGVLMIPIISSLFPELNIQSVIACSLGVISVNSVINLYNFRRIMLHPNIKFVFALGVPTIIGAFGGSLLVNILSKNTVMIIFAVTIIASAAKMIFFSPSSVSEESWDNIFTFKTGLQMSFIGVFAGFISALTGVGGGAIVIPLLVFISIPLKWLPVYSNSAMMFGTTTGLITHALMKTPVLPSDFGILSHFQVGNVNFLIIFGVVVGSLVSSRFGTKLTQRTEIKTKKKVFAVVFVIILLKIFLFS